ncbi:hypothetical protein [Chitinophaga ginsengisegetis]|uniref:hypothetical protein n=1 Tax=Chitinophaga ginsengisegetis TaxID=393003 RepID=UPI000DBAC025|nr:hypothetical protein [Chitinophaga ginsengisegetis]MDR6568141.1 hypothetical protein [Chitinophaga ginsengisegetis]MDR6647304.1 hypothetical protein [Chitinophaga ginsengisegetis]MDR6653653.1 hypothetical protein [Chitinophaga ginsengisegetis]
MKDLPLLKKILWADSLLGGSTAVVGLFWFRTLAVFLGLPVNIVAMIAVVTLAYALLAVSLALQRQPSVLQLRALVYANWLWTITSVVLLIFYISGTTLFGTAFLILQVVVAGMLAYLEGRHIT